MNLRHDALIDLIHANLIYDADTGTFTWKENKSRGYASCSNKIAGSTKVVNNEALTICLNYKYYAIHRLS